MLPKSFDQSKLVHKSGIYQFFDNKGKLLYIGKAIDLNKRISSYFSGIKDGTKTNILVSKIYKVNTIVVESELEALILEANLIKKYLPPFNIRLTDDKDYLYIKITDELFPKVLTARKTDLSEALDYFGPFPSSTVVKRTLKTLRRIFPWCSNPPKLSRVQNPESRNTSSNVKFHSRLSILDSQRKACFYFHLNLCPGACIYQISSLEYRKIINRFRRFMQGRKDSLIQDLAQQMSDYSKKLQFEKANQIKNILTGINYITSPNRVANYLDNPNFLEDQTQKALQELQAKLHLDNPPVRIECYDVSNIQGKNATGSMVVLTNGLIDKRQYRRFKIAIAGRPNDYAMHAEMMQRRLKHSEWPTPDLIIIDGGRGQVNSVLHELEKESFKIPIFGIAKRMELLYPPRGDIYKLPKRSPALRLIQQIRDEAHRFAIIYHRKLRQRQFLNNI